MDFLGRCFCFQMITNAFWWRKKAPKKKAKKKSFFGVCFFGFPKKDLWSFESKNSVLENPKIRKKCRAYLIKKILCMFDQYLDLVLLSNFWSPIKFWVLIVWRIPESTFPGGIFGVIPEINFHLTIKKSFSNKRLKFWNESTNKWSGKRTSVFFCSGY